MSTVFCDENFKTGFRFFNFLNCLQIPKNLIPAGGCNWGPKENQSL